MPLPPQSRLLIIVLGYIVCGPFGGLAYHHFQYVMGLSRLAHEFFFVADSDDYPSGFDPARGVTDIDPADGLRFGASAFEQADHRECWSPYDAHNFTWRGPLGSRATEMCITASVIYFLNRDYLRYADRARDTVLAQFSFTNVLGALIYYAKPRT